MPANKKSRVTSRNSRTAKNRAATKQNSSRRLAAAIPESRPRLGRSRFVDKEDLWIAEKSSLSRQQDVVAWSPHAMTPSDARLLELADIALGLRKPESFRRKKLAFLSGHR